MAGVYVYDLDVILSMSDSDYFIINQGTKLVRLQKSVLLKLLNVLTSEQIEKVETIKVDEDGKLFLNNAGQYRTVTLDDISDLNDGVDDIINAFTVDDDGQLLFNGQSLGGEGGSVYELPVASTDVLGGVKVDGNTITINENGVISGSSNYELPVATTSVLGGVKPDGTTITVDENGVISGASTYELPKATTTNLGGIMVDGITITVNSDGVITCINEGSVIATWSNNVEYPVDCVIVYETTMYKCLEIHTSGETFDSTKWQALTGEKGDAGISPTAKTEQTETGVTISVTDANGTTTSVLNNGKNGNDGITPHIDETTKNWFIGEEDTGILAEGKNGVSPTATVVKTDTGATITVMSGEQTTTADIKNGTTPHIDETTNHWFIGENDTGVNASGTGVQINDDSITGTDVTWSANKINIELTNINNTIGNINSILASVTGGA